MDFRSADASAGYWGDKLYAWCTIYEPKKETLEISVPFDGNIVSAINKLAQELYNQELHPLYDQKFVPEEFFPLNKKEINYLHTKWHYLIKIASEKEVKKALQELLED